MPTIKEYFQNIATAIKQKNTQIVTITPAQMPQAILDIPSGGGDVSFLTPLHKDFSNGYISYGRYYYTPGSYYNDCYELEPMHDYILFYGSTRGNRFRVMRSTISQGDPYDLTSGSISGVQLAQIDSPTISNSLVSFKNQTYETGLLTITKSTEGATDIPSYVLDLSEL